MRSIFIAASFLILASCTSKTPSEVRTPAQTGNIDTFKAETVNKVAGNCVTVVPENLNAEVAIELKNREYQLVYESEANNFTKSAAGFILSYYVVDNKKVVYKLLKNIEGNILFGITKPVKLKSSQLQTAFSNFPNCPYVGGRMDEKNIARTQLYSDMLANKFRNCSVKEDYWHAIDTNCATRVRPESPDYRSHQMDCWGKCFYVENTLFGCYVERMGNVQAYSSYESKDIIEENGKKYNKFLLNDIQTFVAGTCKRIN